MKPVVPLTSIMTHGDGADLPCPWCQSQTAEDDTFCPSCGHRFG